jgi:hypothetical protein
MSSAFAQPIEKMGASLPGDCHIVARTVRTAEVVQRGQEARGFQQARGLKLSISARDRLLLALTNPVDNSTQPASEESVLKIVPLAPAGGTASVFSQEIRVDGRTGR